MLTLAEMDIFSCFFLKIFEDPLDFVRKETKDTPLDNDSEKTRKVEQVAQAMAESIDIVWELIPDQHDHVCGHGFPEGCKQYWRNLANVALAHS